MTVKDTDSIQVDMTREEIYSEIAKAASSSVGERISEALKPLQERANYAKELVNEIRSSVNSPANNDSPMKGKAFRAIRAIAASRARTPDEAASFASKEWGDESLAKALAASDASAGGVTLPSDMSDEVIELLRPMTAVRRLGATTIDMPNGSIEIPKITGSAAVGFTGENVGRNASQPTTGNIILTQKKLIGIVPASNDLLRSPKSNADNLIRTDLTRGIAVREDSAYIRDDGTENTPKGLKNWADTTLTSSGATIANVIDDLKSMLTTLEGADVSTDRAAWIFAPRTKNHLRLLRDTDVFLFREEIDRGQLFGFPIASTSQIPTNLGGGTESEIYLVNMDDALIGETGGLEITAFSEGAYLDSSGAMVSLISNDQTAIRAVLRVDFALRRPESCVVLDTVTWGA